MPEERLQKILARAGLGSRRACEEIIAGGRVTVDGQVVTELGAKADPAAEIRVDGELVHTERRRYVMLHKPAGYLSNPDLRAGYPSWRDLVSVPERLFPVGRLDADSEGLLLLTNDGQLAQRLSHPSFEHPKIYLVRVQGIPDARKIRRLEHGIMLDDGPTAPAEVTLLRELPREWAFLAVENRSGLAADVAETRRYGDADARTATPGLRVSQVPRRPWRSSWLRVTLHEGRKRQLRRMVGRLGHPALRVIRVGLGELALGSLPGGQWRDLTPDEVEVLHQMAARKGSSPRHPAGTPGRGAGHRVASTGSAHAGQRPSAGSEMPTSRMPAPVTLQAEAQSADSAARAWDSTHENFAPSTIAIDGPSASGKSTVGRLLARDLGYLYFDTGVMFRAIACLALDRDIPINDEAAITNLAGQVFLEILPRAVGDGRDVTVLADGVDITMKLRRPDVERAVSPVSAYLGVREVLKLQQRRVGQAGHVVMVGRDIGTVVLPDADLKIYLDATLKERARRRYLERLVRGENPTPEEVLADMKRRDDIDSSREHAPLAAAPDAVIVDTTGLTVEQVMERVGMLVRSLIPRPSPRQGHGTSPRQGQGRGTSGRGEGDFGRPRQPLRRTSRTRPARES